MLQIALPDLLGGYPSGLPADQGAEQNQVHPLSNVPGLPTLPVGLENAEALDNPDWDMLPKMDTLPVMYQMDRGDL